MSDGKYPFESAPSMGEAFSKATREYQEPETPVQKQDEAEHFDAPHLVFPPPNFDAPSIANETWAKWQEDIRSRSVSPPLIPDFAATPHGTAAKENRDNPIQVNICLKEHWINATTNNEPEIEP